MSMEIEGHTSSRDKCKLEISDAGVQGFVWLNVQYENRDQQKPYIVVKLADLLEALGKTTK